MLTINENSHLVALKVLPAKSKEFSKPTEAIALSQSLEDYENLKIRLFVITLALSGFIFLAVTGFYGFKISLNYLLGACTGVVYLKMLANSVDQLGRQKKRLGYSRLGVFIGVMLLATRLDQLLILPIFLGFMTYKAGVLVFVAMDFLPKPNSNPATG